MQSQQQMIDIQYAVTVDGTPEAGVIRQWAQQALPEDKKDVELTIRVVDEAEMTALNHQYRGKNGTTNVLSFPHETIPGVVTDLLGDIVICAPVVATESVAQNKPLDAHWAHMVVHGVLHLLGYDHLRDTEAHEMEARETEILANMDYASPY